MATIDRENGRESLFLKIYWVYGLVIVALLTAWEYRGWSTSIAAVQEVKNVPRTVRDNPGVYRAHYRSQQHYFGGK